MMKNVAVHFHLLLEEWMANGKVNGRKLCHYWPRNRTEFMENVFGVYFRMPCLAPFQGLDKSTRGGEEKVVHEDGADAAEEEALFNAFLVHTSLMSNASEVQRAASAASLEAYFASSAFSCDVAAQRAGSGYRERREAGAFSRPSWNTK